MQPSNTQVVDKLAPDYVMGLSGAETERLILQASYLRPTTQRLFDSIGLKPGMRVLDLGCGAGDVSFLIAERVGPTGSVVGIDRNPGILKTARGRALQDNLRNVEFEEKSVEDLVGTRDFDAVVGRYVLVHQTDVAGFLRAAASQVKPGGYLAFHELSLRKQTMSQPVVPEYERIRTLCQEAFHAAAPQHDAADRLVEHFFAAGLPEPSLFGETPIGCGEETPIIPWIVGVLRSVAPILLKHGLSSESELATLSSSENQLRAAVVQSHSQLSMAMQVCAWCRL